MELYDFYNYAQINGHDKRNQRTPERTQPFRYRSEKNENKQPFQLLISL